MILKCTCKNDYQDAKYGIGNRVMNPAGKDSARRSVKYRCTVCGKEKDK